MTVALEEAPAKFVPAAAVIRMEQALFGITGLKACVGGLQVRSESLGLNPRIASETAKLEYRRGWENS